MKKLIIGFILSAFLCSCGGNTEDENKENTKGQDSTGTEQKKPEVATVEPGDLLVITAMNVNMRTQQKIGDNVITQLDSGDVTKVLKRGKKEKIGDMLDYWYQVEYNGREMWVFGGLTSAKAKGLEADKNKNTKTPDNVMIGTFEKIMETEDASYFVMSDQNGNEQKLRIDNGYEGQEMFSSAPEDMQGLEIRVTWAREKVKDESAGKNVSISRLKKVEMLD